MVSRIACSACARSDNKICRDWKTKNTILKKLYRHHNSHWKERTCSKCSWCCCCSTESSLFWDRNCANVVSNVMQRVLSDCTSRFNSLNWNSWKSLKKNVTLRDEKTH
jgi:hypothetical protein